MFVSFFIVHCCSRIHVSLADAFCEEGGCVVFMDGLNLFFLFFYSHATLISAYRTISRGRTNLNENLAQGL